MINSVLVTQKPAKAVPIYSVTPKDYAAWLKKQPASLRNWLNATAFEVEPGKYRLVADSDGKISSVVACFSSGFQLWQWANLSEKLPADLTYYPAEGVSDALLQDAALGWLLGSYQFTQYKKGRTAHAKLCVGKKNIALAQEMAESIFLTRNLINIPANDLGPSALAAQAKKLAKECGATYQEIVGDALLKKNYPTIHAVGRAAADAPRLIDLQWGNPKHKKLTIVGKGVCFDTGGLNIKTGNNMNLMKKDMGGAAFSLGLARLIIKRKLPVRLRVLIPAVENSVSGNAFRPQDIIRTRAGITVEIGNTDAEGRLILCDALYEADQEKPDLLLDFATLTGASRVALGPDIPSFFTPSDALATTVETFAKQHSDPLWRLPLWQEYEYFLHSHAADTDNAGGRYAGAIVAALFLKKFVTNTKDWLHVDMMAWNLRDRPGRPTGGEAQGIRGLYQLLEARYKRSHD